MGAKLLDFTGHRFGRLLVIKKEKSISYGKTKKRAWLCKCDCGIEKVLNTGALTSGNTKSCGCLHDELSGDIGRNSRYKLAKPDAGYTSIMNVYKRNAINRNHEFNLNFNQFKDIIISNCHYCGIEPSNNYFKNYYDIKYNGIDRLDNNKGYYLDNVVPCCKICNVAKNNNSYEEFINWINRISNHSKLLS